MLRNILASGASALVGFGLVGALPPMSAYRGGQDGETKAKQVEAPQVTATGTLVFELDETQALLRQAYDRLRRIRAERLEDRQKALVERAAEMYRRAIKAHEAKEADLTRGQVLAALELVRAVEQARAAREIARPDPDLPAPPAPLTPSVPSVPATPAVPLVAPVPPLPPLPPPIEVRGSAVSGSRATAKALGSAHRVIGKRLDQAKIITKPDGEIATIDIVGDTMNLITDGKAADEIKTVIVQDKEGKPLTIRTEPLRVVNLVADPARIASEARSFPALTLNLAHVDGDPAEARAKLRQAYEAVKKAREGKKTGENRTLLDTARDLYNSARAAAEAGDHARASGLAQAAISLASVPNVDPKTFEEISARYFNQAMAEAHKTQATLQKHQAELAAHALKSRKDQKRQAEERVEVEVIGKAKVAEALAKAKAGLERDKQTVTIVQGHPLATVVEGKPLQAQVDSSCESGAIEVRVSSRIRDVNGKPETIFEIHTRKDGQEIPTDQLKLEKKDTVYILRLDAKEAKKEKESKKEKETKKEKEKARTSVEVKEISPRVFIQQLEKAKIGEGDQALDESIVGIGVSIREDEGQMIVQELIPSGPAAKDGRLKTGDRIVGVEGEDGKVIEFADQPLEAAVNRIRGPEGSKIKLVVEPTGSEERKTYELTRARIVVPPAPEAVEVKDSPKDKGDDLPPEIQD